jgi:acetoin utilization deacetylase AcuC-like enzyme
VLASEFATERQLLAVHDAAYLLRLRATGNAPMSQPAAAALLAGTEAELNAWAAGVAVAHPFSPPAGEKGANSDLPTSDFTANVAALAAGGACLAVDAVASGAAVNAFSILRPPGHHCGASTPAGFCARRGGAA